MATRNYEGKKFEKGLATKIADALTIEEALQININNKPFTVTMRTPGNDKSLVRGLLHTEGILKNTGYSPKLIFKKENNKGIITVVELTIPKEELGEGYSNSRSLLSVSSCGICGRTELGDLSSMGKSLDNSTKIEVSSLHILFEKMNAQQSDFLQSGGTHAAAAFSLQGKLLCIMEDIGRHNAVDKVIGKLILLQYISDGNAYDLDSRIPKLAEEAVYKWIAYGCLSARSDIPEYMIARFKKEKFAETRKAKLRLSNIKLEELTQILRGKSKQIKH